MSKISPVIQLHQQSEGLLIPYPAPGHVPADHLVSPLLVAAFDPVEIEYAAIRRHAAIFDQPHRALLRIDGADRIEFLNRMLTQELSPLKGFSPWTARSSFWLTRKGRIDADLRVLCLPDHVLLDVDVHAAPRARTGLESYVITEDVAITDLTESWHRFVLHGPASAALVFRLSQYVDGPPLDAIQPGQVAHVRIAGALVTVERRDATGEIGLELATLAADAQSVYETLSSPPTSWSARTAQSHAPPSPRAELARRIGWHALNIARIEAGTPIYYLDFGPDSLPHESGVLRDRVSFTKGCYLGQEVVARMDALGHPKQRLVALDIQDGPLTDSTDVPTDTPRGSGGSGGGGGQPDTGTPIFAHGTDPAAQPAQPVGVVTSSCISPMLGAKPIALAMVKWSHATPGTRLRVDPPRQAAILAVVREALPFLPQPR